jgi:GNAT superfamily N-acetyltransferase
VVVIDESRQDNKLWPNLTNLRLAKNGRRGKFTDMKKNKNIEDSAIRFEYALEIFPVSLKLRDGTAVFIRPVCSRDETRLHKFLSAVPEEERLFIKKPIFHREIFREWFRHPDFEENLMLLMLHGGKIAGEATLSQRPGGWKRHIGVITVLTHPDYRGRDVAKILVTQQIEIARALGLSKLESELNGERKVAIRALEDLGFHYLMRRTDYVLDMKAVPHDYILMGLDLKVDEEYAGVGE